MTKRAVDGLLTLYGLAVVHHISVAVVRYWLSRRTGRV